MTPKPVVIIPPRSPRLEAIALAVLWGAADQSRTVPVPLFVAEPTENLPTAADAPRVFVGWRADIEESRKLAAQTLEALSRSGGPSRQIATFEVALRDSPSDSIESPSDEGPAGRLSGPGAGPSERFLIDRGTGGDTAGLLELVRARRWGGQTYSHWYQPATAPPSEARPPEDATPSRSREIPWCGIDD
ncbi:MAG: hypothetical protein ABR888_04035 [Thermoplasmata archaeon]|jgi:hypothetical protein